MSFTFNGPFDITARTKIDGTLERFTISGSDGADGHHDFDYGATVQEVSVTGEEWTISFQLRFGTSSAWRHYEPDQYVVSTTTAGFTVHIAGPPVVDGDIQGPTLVLDCVSTDPALSPPHTTHPDLTLPGR